QRLLAIGRDELLGGVHRQRFENRGLELGFVHGVLFHFLGLLRAGHDQLQIGAQETAAALVGQVGDERLEADDAGVFGVVLLLLGRGFGCLWVGGGAMRPPPVTASAGTRQDENGGSGDERELRLGLGGSLSGRGLGLG